MPFCEGEPQRMKKLRPRLRPLLAAGALALTLAGCANSGNTESAGPVQGWSGDARSSWSNASQGSRMMPYAWFKALAQPGGTAPFMADDYLATFRIVPQPGRLPIGFAIDRGSDKDLSVSRL